MSRPVRRMDRTVSALMDDMVDTMRAAPGIGLAAPQVGLELRVIVAEVPLDPDDPDAGTRLFMVANPQIVWASEALAEDQEGCLSVPELYGDVNRHVDVRVQGLNRKGRTETFELSQLSARVFQHEIDHLNGILFTDRVSGVDKLYHLEKDKDGNTVRVAYRVPIL